MSPRPPRAVQKQIVAKWYADVAENRDSATVSDAHLRLSACRLLGFGLEKDWNACLVLLQKAMPGSPMARAIYPRVARAMKSDGIAKQDRPTDAPGSSIFSHRVYHRPSRMIITPNMFRAPQLSMQPRHDYSASRISSILSIIQADLPNAMSITRLEDLWKQKQSPHDNHTVCDSQGTISQLDISKSLTEACRTRSVELAKALAAMCVQFVGPRGEPTPLHWLVRFSPDDADHLARLLIAGPTDDRNESVRSKFCQLFDQNFHGTRSMMGGICYNFVNAQTDCGVCLPEHCLELFGTPLHWAIRCNNSSLVKTLLMLGADLNARFKVRRRQPGEPSSSVSYAYSPLDLALEFHLYDIVADLLDRTQHDEVPIEIGASLIARTTTTWSRFVIHGSSYRSAIRKTIQALQKAGWAMERQDHYGMIPVLVALDNAAEERYIIEELLLTTRNVPKLTFPEDLGTFMVTRSDTEYPSDAWKFEKVLPLIVDLNSQSNGFSMLHYCAILGNTHIAAILLSTRRVNLNDRSTRPKDQHCHTPLMYAAEFGHTEVARLLLEAGVNVDSSAAAGECTPLEMAVTRRHFHTASLLIEKGAKFVFHTGDNILPSHTILHTSCIQSNGRPSMLKRLMDTHPQLRDPSIVNQLGTGGAYHQTTALWQAVHYADLEAVKALLDCGADPTLCTSKIRFEVLGTAASDTTLPNIHTPRSLVDRILRRAESPNRLDPGQMRAALHGESESMRSLPFLSEVDITRERALVEVTSTVAQYNFRLEDVQAADQSKAGIRAFIDRLLEIRKLLDEHIELQNAHLQKERTSDTLRNSTG
jgi:ankyrin repeat protein